MTVSRDEIAAEPVGSTPPELLAAIETIRARLPVVEDFSEMFEMFVQQLARSPALWSSSQRREHAALRAIVHQVAQQLRPGFVVLHDSFYEICDTGFWHGAVVGINGLASVFYDERAGMGLMGLLCDPLEGAGLTHFARITHLPEVGWRRHRGDCN